MAAQPCPAINCRSSRTAARGAAAHDNVSPLSTELRKNTLFFVVRQKSFDGTRGYRARVARVYHCNALQCVE